MLSLQEQQLLSQFLCSQDCFLSVLHGFIRCSSFYSCIHTSTPNKLISPTYYIVYWDVCCMNLFAFFKLFSLLVGQGHYWSYWNFGRTLLTIVNNWAYTCWWRGWRNAFGNSLFLFCLTKLCNARGSIFFFYVCTIFFLPISLISFFGLNFFSYCLFN